MIGLPYGEKNYDDMLSRFHLTPERDRQTDRQICYITIVRQTKGGLGASHNVPPPRPEYAIACLFLTVTDSFHHNQSQCVFRRRYLPFRLWPSRDPNYPVFSSTAACNAAELIVSAINVCLDVVKRYSAYSFCPIFAKLGTRDLRANTQKTVERVFEILLSEFLANFWNFTFGLSLGS